MGNYNKKVVVSRPYHNFNLIYDGTETYYLFYNDKEVASTTTEITPEQLHDESMKKNRVTSKVFQDIDNSDYSPLAKMLLYHIDEIANKPVEKSNTYQELVRTIKDSYKDKDVLMGFIGNSSDIIQDKLLELSSYYDNEDQEDLILLEDKPLTVEEQIEARRNPVLTPSEKETVEILRKDIEEQGIIEYLNRYLDDIQIGDHRNIIRKILAVECIMKGKYSFIFETVAEKEAGKSFEDEIVFGMITPQRYIFKMNDMTWSAFTRFGQVTEDYFDRMIIVFGDFGSEKSFNKIEEVFNVYKVLITEKEYSRALSEKIDDTYEIVDFKLKVDSIGCVYSTTKNSFTKDDDQLVSRTFNSTPPIASERDVLELLFFLNKSMTKQSIAKAKAVEKLNEFGLYMLSLVNNDMEIINPYMDVFIDYASKSSSPKRELKQQMELFEAYCELTSYKCENIDGYQVASIEQLEEFMNNINLENALIPYENDFLKMIMGKGYAHELTILYDIDLEEHKKDIMDKDNLTDEEKEELISKIDSKNATTLMECENNAVSFINDGQYDSKFELNTTQLKEMPSKLNMLYGARGTSVEHTGERIFFRVTDIQNIHGRKKAFKNIDNVSELLNTLYNKGYLGKYEYQFNGKNLYYLTPKCEDILIEFKPNKSFEDYWKSFKKQAGL